MDEQVRKFNGQVRELITLLEAELPDNEMIETASRKFRLAVSIDRTCIIEEAMPELMGYRDFIADGRIDELVAKDWDSEVESHIDDDDDDVDKNSIRELIKLLKEIWDGYDSESRHAVAKILKRMLSYAIKYQRAKLSGQL